MEILLDTPDCHAPSAMTPTQHCTHPAGHDGDCSWAAEEQVRRGRLRVVDQLLQEPCGVLRPHDPRQLSCELSRAHFGQHAATRGTIRFMWDGNAISGCPSRTRHSDERLSCLLTEGHAGNHENGDHDWADD